MNALHLVFTAVSVPANGFFLRVLNMFGTQTTVIDTSIPFPLTQAPQELCAEPASSATREGRPAAAKPSRGFSAERNNFYESLPSHPDRDSSGRAGVTLMIPHAAAQVSSERDTTTSAQS